MAEYRKKWKTDDEIAEAISRDQEKETNEVHREFLGEAGEKEIEFVLLVSNVSIDALFLPGHEKCKTLVLAKRVNDYWIRKQLVSVYPENYKEIYRGVMSKAPQSIVLAQETILDDHTKKGDGKTFGNLLVTMLFEETDRIYARGDKALEERNLTKNREL